MFTKAAAVWKGARKAIESRWCYNNPLSWHHHIHVLLWHASQETSFENMHRMIHIFHTSTGYCSSHCSTNINWRLNSKSEWGNLSQWTFCPLLYFSVLQRSISVLLVHSRSCLPQGQEMHFASFHCFWWTPLVHQVRRWSKGLCPQNVGLGFHWVCCESDITHKANMVSFVYLCALNDKKKHSHPVCYVHECTLWNSSNKGLKPQ